ncbi:MAG: sugar transferase [Bacteroidota bacterium]|nr:sugar transferase [Bacteroidota bacterium]MEE3038087.1 sugar transferase [Bacteroidota bacterium]
MVKRTFDLIASFFGLFLVFPVLLIVSVLVALDSRGPIIFKQQRVGRYGKLFTMVKFRTMKVKQESSSTVSIKGDKRITRIGAFLRKTKIDELPELWNVLVGEMSLVGPRPDVEGFADQLQNESRKILELRPGITGPASLKFANEEALLASVDNPERYNREVIYPEKVKLNLEYYYQQNLMLDIKIIFATIFRKS